MHLKTWLLILLNLTAASPTLWAQQLQTPIKATRVTKGAAAPFDGTLLTNEAVAKLLTDKEVAAKLLQLEIDKLKRELVLERQNAELTCKVQVEGERLKYQACNAEAQAVRGQLGQVINPPWYKSPYLHFLVGGLLGSGITGGICVAAIRIK